MQTSRLSIGSTAVALLALALAAAACGGEASGSANRVASLSGKTATTRGEESSGDQKSFEDAMLEYAKCMRQHGIDMPDPTFIDNGNGRRGVITRASGGPGSPGGGKPDDATFKAAETACEPIMQAAEQNMPRPSPEEEAERRDRALKFAQCMRDHGIDMPDPTFDSNGRTRIERRGDASGGETAGAGGASAAVAIDEKFEAAMKACEKDSPMKIARGEQ